MAVLVRFPAPPRVRRRASCPRAAWWLLVGAFAVRRGPSCGPAFPAPADPERGASRRHTCGSAVDAGVCPAPREACSLSPAPPAEWDSRRWSSATAASTARTSERRSSPMKRSWTRPTNSSRSSSRTGSRSSARSRVSVRSCSGEFGAAALYSESPACCRLPFPGALRNAQKWVFMLV